MKVLFDQNAPRPLIKYMAKHSVTLAPDLEWDRLKNGALLEAAEAEGFQVLVASDKNLKYQQKLSSRKMAIVEAVDHATRVAIRHSPFSENRL